jgi:hypothetical protein
LPPAKIKVSSKDYNTLTPADQIDNTFRQVPEHPRVLREATCRWVKSSSIMLLSYDFLPQKQVKAFYVSGDKVTLMTT